VTRLGRRRPYLVGANLVHNYALFLHRCSGVAESRVGSRRFAGCHCGKHRSSRLPFGGAERPLGAEVVGGSSQRVGRDWGASTDDRHDAGAGVDVRRYHRCERRDILER